MYAARMQVHGRLHSEFKLLYVLPYPVAVINGIDYIVSFFYVDYCLNIVLKHDDQINSSFVSIVIVV